MEGRGVDGASKVCVFDQRLSIPTSSLCCDLSDLSPSLTGPACFHWAISVNRLYGLRDPSGPNWHWDCGQSLGVILLFARSNLPKWRQQLYWPLERSAALVCPTFTVCPLQSSGHKGEKMFKEESASIYFKMSRTITAVPVLQLLCNVTKTCWGPSKGP